MSASLMSSLEKNGFESRLAAVFDSGGRQLVGLFSNTLRRLIMDGERSASPIYNRDASINHGPGPEAPVYNL